MAGRRGSPAASAPLSVFLSLFYVRHVLRVTVTPNFGWYNFCGALWGRQRGAAGADQLLHYDGVGAV